MRVIAGSARRLLLKSTPGRETRPTQDIIKETLFNMIQMAVPGSRFLDLFAGSGSIGIEALSRDASKAYFVENNKKAADIIEENLAATRLVERSVIMRMDVLQALRRLEGREKFDIIYMDPPYHLGLEEKVLSSLAGLSLADRDCMVIVEASVKTDLSYVEELGFQIEKDKRYKTNRHLFLRKK